MGFGCADNPEKENVGVFLAAGFGAAGDGVGAGALGFEPPKMLKVGLFWAGLRAGGVVFFTAVFLGAEGEMENVPGPLTGVDFSVDEDFFGDDFLGGAEKNPNALGAFVVFSSSITGAFAEGEGFGAAPPNRLNVPDP